MKRQIAIFFLIVALFTTAALVCVFLPTPAHDITLSAEEQAACDEAGGCHLVTIPKLKAALVEAQQKAYAAGVEDGRHAEALRSGCNI